GCVPCCAGKGSRSTRPCDVGPRVVILLDTNYLIRALLSGTPEAERVDMWAARDDDLCTSSICWYEFLCGPVDAEGIDIVRGILRDRIIPFTVDAATEAARLFNASGRARARRVDAMVAAAAIVGGASLATENTEDFRPLVAEGLRIV
ncbi:MAG: type II toxin-antitoxin system VapC family toxin, partial [Spirochaetota bacterium]